jgi:integrase/recombinase XerD
MCTQLQPQPQTSLEILPPSQTDEETLVTLWLANTQSPHTRRAYEREWRQFMEFANRPIRTIRLETVVQYLSYLEEQGLKPASVNRALAALRSLFSFAQKTGFMTLNPAAGAKPRRVRRSIANRILSREQVREVIELMPTPEAERLAEFLYQTGARISEALAVRRRHISDGYVELFGKGGKTRTVSIPRELAKALMDGDPDDLVFPFSERDVRRWFSYAGFLLDIEGLSPHWFRHSHATHALENGCPLHVLRDSLGHSDIGVTSAYLHVRPETSSGDYLGSSRKGGSE